MKAIWVCASAALLVLLAQAPASSKTPVHHVYGHMIHGIIINHCHPKGPGYRPCHPIHGIIIVHPGQGPGPIGVPVNSPSATTK